MVCGQAQLPTKYQNKGKIIQQYQILGSIIQFQKDLLIVVSLK